MPSSIEIKWKRAPPIPMQVSLTPVLPRVRMGMPPAFALAGFAATALPSPANVAPKNVRLCITPFPLFRLWTLGLRTSRKRRFSGSWVLLSSLRAVREWHSSLQATLGS